MTRTPPALLAVRTLLLATPLFALLAPAGFYFPYIVPRAIFFRALVLVAAAAVLVLVLRRGVKLEWRQDPLFVALAALLAVGAISALFSPAPWQSIYGDLERMGGVVTGAILLLYYVLLRSFLEPRHWRWFFRVTVGVAVLVSLYGLAQAGPRAVESTLGNSGLLGAYLLFHIGFAAAAALRYAGMDRAGFVAALLPISTTFMLAQNRSSLLGLAVGAVVAVLLLSARWPARRRRWAYGLAALPALLVAIPLANRISPELELHDRLPGVAGKLAWAGAAESRDAIRLASWRAGLEGFRERPLLGHGPENFHLVWDRHSAGVVTTRHSRFDRAHNQYIDILAMTGLVGALAFALLWLAALLMLWRAVRSGALPPRQGAVWLGLLVAYAVYLFFWFEDVNSGILWMATLAFLGTAGSEQTPVLRLVEPADRPLRRPLAVAGIVAIAFSLYLHAFETARVSRILHTAAVPGRMVEGVLDDYRKAFRSAAPQTRDALSGYLAVMGRLAPTFEEARQDPYRAELLHASFQHGYHFVDELQRRNPRDHQLLLADAMLSLHALRFYRTTEQYDRALAAATRAAELAPGRMPPRYMLVEIHLLGGQHDLAAAQVDTALAMAGAHGETRYYQAKVYEARGDIPAAARALRLAADLGYAPDRPLTDDVMRQLEGLGADSLAADLGQAYLAGRWRGWPGGPGRPDRRRTMRPTDLEIARRLPLIALRSADTTLAVQAALALGSVDPASRAAVARFIGDLRADRLDDWADAPPGTTFVEAGSPRHD